MRGRIVTNPNEELVEKIAISIYSRMSIIEEVDFNNKKFSEKPWNTLSQDAKDYFTSICGASLNVILSDVSKVAMVCPDCGGTGRTFEFDAETNTPNTRQNPKCLCKGTGVVPRNEMEGVEK
jgi:hypothetical protein